MFSELIELLRCVRPHEPTGLVAAADRVVDRDILLGRLGCPACAAEYPVEHAVADFRLHRPGPPLPAAKGRVEDALALRAGALLNVVDPSGVVVLAGAWTLCAPELAALVAGITVLALDAGDGVVSGDGVSLARTAGEIPLRAGSARGVALDRSHATPEYVASAAEVVAPLGRLIAPVATPLPPGFTELARDAQDWVAERAAAPAVVPLRRAPREAARGAGGQPPASPPDA